MDDSNRESQAEVLLSRAMIMLYVGLALGVLCIAYMAMSDPTTPRETRSYTRAFGFLCMASAAAIGISSLLAMVGIGRAILEVGRQTELSPRVPPADRVTVD